MQESISVNVGRIDAICKYCKLLPITAPWVAYSEDYPGQHPLEAMLALYSFSSVPEERSREGFQTFAKNLIQRLACEGVETRVET
jgi:hypothetical protein